MIQHNTNIALPANSLIIAVAGVDACKFLQGQLTCDVATLADGQSTLGAYCNIKGKVDSLFTLQRIGEDYFLSMHPDLIASTIQELKKYAIFSKVKLETVEKTTPKKDEQQEILDKIPALYSQTIGTFFPHDLNLPKLGAVSFTKGCYRGQEIVARMEHRGKLKRSLYAFNTQGNSIQPGSTIQTREGVHAGTVVRYCDMDESILGLAVISDNLAAEELIISNQKINLLDV